MNINNQISSKEDLFIFAIDPSINFTGWSYLFCQRTMGESVELKIRLLDSGVVSIKDKSSPILEKMNYIFQKLKKKLSSLHLDVIVVEETLVNINPFTSLKLSKGQCAAICSCLSLKKEMHIYSCKSARKLLLNNGNASKQECREFVEKKLSCEIKNEHIADSILIGINHYYRNSNYSHPDLIKAKKKSKKKKTDV